MGARVQEEETMKCVICKQAETRPGKATVTLERDGATLVIKGVPARVCPNCGEEYVEEEITERLLQTAEEAARAGVQVDIREYVAV
jgi:YgiT-type zinc finger domain-containing protein